MNTLCKRSPRACERLFAAVLFCALVGATWPYVTHGRTYVDLRRIEPITGDMAKGAEKTTVCIACHGPNGNSIVPQFPRLAGQRAAYIYHRLVEFKTANPKDPAYSSSPMPAQAQNLSEEDMRNIAVYFAAQAPTPSAPQSSAAPVDRGQELYTRGDPALGIPPCQGCHGPGASGGPTDAGSQYLAYPVLRSQHPAYLTSRLNNFRNGLPNRSSDDFIMQSVARTLDDASIEALGAWLAGLAPLTAR
jgi:cytochrome c553